MESRIVTNPEILGGKACVRGTRISVEFLLELSAGGASIDAIVAAYPRLTSEDVTSAVQYAAECLRRDFRRRLGRRLAMP
jgi:uncharacterized protein (DUF433 family)